MNIEETMESRRLADLVRDMDFEISSQIAEIHLLRAINEALLEALKALVGDCHDDTDEDEALNGPSGMSPLPSPRQQEVARCEFLNAELQKSSDELELPETLYWRTGAINADLLEALAASLSMLLTTPTNRQSPLLRMARVARYGRKGPRYIAKANR